MNLYTALIEENDPASPFVQVYWARANHMGAALEMMLTAARSNGFLRPIWRQADPFDIKNLPKQLKQYSTQDVFWGNERYGFPATDTLELPYGIISSCIEGEFDVDEIQVGFHVHKDGEMFTLEVNVSEQQLATLYFGLLDEYKKFRVFWYKLHSDWEGNGNEEMFVNENLSTGQSIRHHLEGDVDNSIRNGHCTITAYLEDGATNINISDHKKIVVITYSESKLAIATRFLNAHRIPLLDPFVTVDYKIHHWHFRSPQSCSRAELIRRLETQGFSRWAPGADKDS
jgi:hypothetical protein